jgi:hypothetical protein
VTRHPIAGAVLVVIAGTFASWLALVSTWMRHFDPHNFHE